MSAPDPLQEKPADPPPARFLQVLGAVFWSFLGIRKRASGERDAVTVKPQHIIAAGLLGVALFVTILVLLVRWLTRAA